jgi:hypothetical protein
MATTRTTGPLEPLSRRVSCTWVARRVGRLPRQRQAKSVIMSLNCGYVVERVTRIELALSAWEALSIRSITFAAWGFGYPWISLG